MFWELYQQHRIGKAEAQAEVATTKARQSQQRVRDLEQRVDRLALINMALWEIVSAQLNLADDFGTLNGCDGMVSFGDFLALLGLVGPCP